MSWGVVQLEQEKAIRVRQLYLGDKTNMNGSELDKDFPNLQF